MQSRTQDVRGVPMRWLETGKGYPVILVHGIPTSPRLWRKVIPLLHDARVLAWEMVGYGESIPEGRGRDISVGRQADYLLDWLEALDIRRAVLVGHDLGGGVVQIAAVRNPAVCAGLILTNSICYDSWPIPSVRLMRAAEPLTSRLRGKALEFATRMLFWRGHDDTDIANESQRVHLQPYHAHGGGEALVRQMKALDTRDTLGIQDELQRFRDRPNRVIWGAADPFQKLQYGRRLAWDLDAQMTEIQDGRHFVPEDHPDLIALAVREVLGELKSQAIAPDLRPRL